MLKHAPVRCCQSNRELINCAATGHFGIMFFFFILRPQNVGKANATSSAATSQSRMSTPASHFSSSNDLKRNNSYITRNVSHVKDLKAHLSKWRLPPSFRALMRSRSRPRKRSKVIKIVVKTNLYITLSCVVMNSMCRPSGGFHH